MKNKWAAIASFSLAMAVALGAYHAHGMKDLVDAGKISEKYLATFYTGVLYQFINSLGLLILALQLSTWRRLVHGQWLIFTGMCIFSFSLYILSFNELLSEKLKILGAITPLGGVGMIAGWIWIGLGFLKQENK